MRFLDRFARPRANEDAASGVFLFGEKGDRPLAQKSWSPIMREGRAQSLPFEF
jgi:hypothetical protein